MRGPGLVRVSSGKWLVDAIGAAYAKDTEPIVGVFFVRSRPSV